MSDRVKLSNIQVMLSNKIKEENDKLVELQDIINDYDDYDDYLDGLYDERNVIQDKMHIYLEILDEVNKIVKGGD